MSRSLVLAFVAIFCLISGGCSSTPEVTAVPATVAENTTITLEERSTTAPEAPAKSIDSEGQLSEVALAYFEQLTERRSTTEHAEPGSPAERYAWYLMVLNEAVASTFGPSPLPSMEIKGSTVEFTVDGKTDVYDDIVASPDGVRTFTVQGNKLEDRLMASSVVEAGPLSAEPGVTYFSISEVLITTLVITNNSDETVSVNTWSAEFVNSQGTQIQVEEAFGPTDLRAGATASFGFFWPGSDPVGTLYLGGSNADFSQSFELKLDFSETL